MPRARVTIVAIALAVLALAGCAQGPGSSSHPIASRTSGTPTASGAPTAPTTTPSGSPAPAPTSAPVAGQCATADLVGTIGPEEGGAAGHVGVTLILTNTGATQCSLQGWPGVSFVGNGNGTQLGAPAVFMRNTPHPTVVLQPGGAAHALLLVGNASNYPNPDCVPQKADGFRVYPPGSTTSLFVADDQFIACTSSTAPLLQVGALTSG